MTTQVVHKVTKKILGFFDIRNGGKLRGVNLREANLSGVNLCAANLAGANLSGADLDNSYMGSANLRGANLRGANLYNVDLSLADLRDTDLRDTDLRCTDLYKANITRAKLPKFQLPQTKSLLVWKKLASDRLCQLRIPARAKRTASLIGNKCRAERAFVVAIWAGRKKVPYGRSMHDFRFTYDVGLYVNVEDYDSDPRIECAPGIHFFRTRLEAKNYYYY